MGLDASVTVESADDEVIFQLAVRNDGERPVELTFRSGQTAEFVVTNDGESVWRWSGERLFTQQVRTETLSPGSEKTAVGRWTDPTVGEYTVEATLATTGERAAAETVSRA